MARLTAVIIVTLTGVLAVPSPTGPNRNPVDARPRATHVSALRHRPELTEVQADLVALAISRFESQGLDLPQVGYVFHEDLLPCEGHKGMYHKTTLTLEMCSLDLHTMLHELAHAWANANLTQSRMNALVGEWQLDSWNDHDDAWDRRGTEHAAETIAWALDTESRHVRWVETLADGSALVTHRILTIGVDVETLLDRFSDLTGHVSVFRHPDEWAEDGIGETPSPEAARFGG